MALELSDAWGDIEMSYSIVVLSGGTSWSCLKSDLKADMHCKKTMRNKRDMIYNLTRDW